MRRRIPLGSSPMMGHSGKMPNPGYECGAMEDALVWVARNAVESEDTVILTNSLSLVSKTSRRCMKKEWFSLLRAHVKRSWPQGQLGRWTD